MTYKVQGTEVINANAEVSVAGFTSSNADSYIEILSPAEEIYTFQGTVSGYASGGFSPTKLVIDKFPFAVDTNATNIGNLTQARARLSGQSSSISGYTSGGYSGPPAGTYTNVIDKFPFSVDTNATDVGDLSTNRTGPSGQSSGSHGYAFGGVISSGPIVASTSIDKFPFSSDTNATNIGDVSISVSGPAGQSSSENGYSSGGESPAPAFVNHIQRFPFASDGNASDVGDLIQARRNSAGQSSSTFGYTSGGTAPPFTDTIDKFSFATHANATDVGNLLSGRYALAGVSSTTSGYTAGGFNPAVVDTLEKFPFATDSNSTDVGDLSVATRGAAGQQD